MKQIFTKNLTNKEKFCRGRSDSTLSNYSTPGSRLSPSVEEYESYWGLSDTAAATTTAQMVTGELLDMTGNMRLSASQLKTPPFAGTVPRVPVNGECLLHRICK